VGLGGGERGKQEDQRGAQPTLNEGPQLHTIDLSIRPRWP
jgi:hypothetical protein